MRKGQSLVVEFILFFMISFSLFSIISFFFYNQNEFFKERIGETSIDLINDIMSTHFINIISCKSCNSTYIKENLPSKVGGLYYNVTLTQTGLNTSLISEKIYFKESNIFNINETFSGVNGLSGSTTSEDKIVEIQIDNINKRIVIS